MKAVEIAKNIYWVGTVDWDLRDFHGYMTQRGSSYNAYLIMDEKITLIDNCKEYLTQELIQRIESITPVSSIDYFIQNHIEMDHSGALPQLLARNSKGRVYLSKRGAANIGGLFDIDENRIEAVEMDTKLNIGKRELSFLATPMVHWPDNMFTYCKEDKILFSNDAFGQHIASSERIDSDYFFDVLMQEAKKYYANIVLCYSAQVQRALTAASGLKIETIAPSHGIIWKKYIPQILEAYNSWSSYEADKQKAVIIYDTMWNSTKTLAYSIAEAFEQKGVFVEILSLQKNHISDIMTKLVDAKYIAVGSSTLNKQILPTVSSFLTYLKGLAPKKKTGFAFGSYGWGSGESIKIIENELTNCNFEMMGSFKVKNIPKKEDLEVIKQIVLNKVEEQ